MAEPYLIFKAHTGIYYAQIPLTDGTISNNKSTGCKNRTEAESIAMRWAATPELLHKIAGVISDYGFKDVKEWMQKSPWYWEFELGRETEKKPRRERE